VTRPSSRPSSRHLLLAALLGAGAGLLAWGCPSSPPVPADDDDATTPAADDDDTTPGDDDDSTNPESPAAWHPALDDLPCASGEDCADAGPFIEDTCCTLGDSLRAVATGSAAEAVDVDVSPNGRFVALCGGFGARINDLADPDNPVLAATVTSRCQRSAWGPELEDGTLVLYLAHHGDSWVPEPFLTTVHVDPDGDATQVTSESTPGVLYEGLRWHDGHLYVAAHAGGVRVYLTEPEGAPVHIGTVPGFTNAWKLDVGGPANEHLFVADDTRLQVLDISTPANATIVGGLDLVARARDVDAEGDRVYVATGGDGVEIVDISDPTSPSRVATIALEGSAQAVRAQGDLLAVAAWTYVALYDTERLKLIGTEQTRGAGEFEQDFGVDFRNGRVFVAEWERLYVLQHRPGYVAPDIWLTEQLFDFNAEDASTRTTEVINRGPLPLEVSSVTTTDPALTVSASSLTVEPGQRTDLVLTYTPPAPDPASQRLVLQTNDVDPGQIDIELFVRVAQTGQVNVGDSITSAWGFLDPTGQDDVANLEGKVLFLAYFALF